jgi:hypothetical protein
MTRTGYAVVRIIVGAATRRRLDLLDLARRQADHLGRPGILAKKRQTNRRYRRKGYLRLRFPSRRLARAYIARVARLDEPVIRYRLMRNPNPYR